MKKLLDFDLEIALKEPERVVFADGTNPIEWYYFKNVNWSYPLYLIMDSNKEPVKYTKLGKFHDSEINHPKDLKLLPKTKMWWFCVYRNCLGQIFASNPCEDKEQMKETINYVHGEILQEYTYTEELP